MSGTEDGGKIGRLQARLDGERAKVRKLVASQERAAAEQASLEVGRRGLERRLAVLESQHDLLIAAQAPGREPGPPLRVLVVGVMRKTIFEFIEGAMVTGDPALAPFDVVVIPRPEKRDLAELARGVPEAVWDAVRSGRTRLVLDGSSEGRLHRVVLERFRALAQQTGAPLRDVVYLIQDRLAGRPGACAEARPDAPVRIVNYDYYLHKTLLPMLKHGPAAFENRMARYLRAPGRGRRAFLTLNLSPRGHRVLLLARLLRDGLWDRGFVSFGGFGPQFGGDELASRVNWQGLETAGADVAPWLPELHRKGAVLFGIRDDAGVDEVARQSLRSADLEEYRLSWFSVVTETEMTRDQLRVTEKILKPLLNFHPFVVLGSPGALRLVRSYGFETFPELFDESYDDEEDPVRRFDMVYDQVRRLAHMDEAELGRLNASVAEKVVFNARWGMTRLPGLFQHTLLPAVLERILRAPLGRA